MEHTATQHDFVEFEHGANPGPERAEAEVRKAPPAFPGWVPADQIREAIGERAHRNWSVEGPDPVFMEKQQEVIWDFLLDRYFRVEMTGWERLPGRTSLLAGIHSGTWLTMDAWTLCAMWWRKFGQERILHGTAHDALMAFPGIGGYFRKVGVIPAARDAVTEALAANHDVIVWPGGEVDAMRSWRKRDKVVLAGRKGFIRQAMRSNVPIVPVATTGGHDTVFVLSEGRTLARILRAKQWLRTEMGPIILGFPFGISLEVLPMHLPLPAKIRIEILEPLTPDPGEIDNQLYVDEVYDEVRHRIQQGVNALAKKRKFFAFG